MAKPVSPDIFEAFDPEQVDMITRVIDRAWQVISHDEHGDEAEARHLLSLCVMSEARSGEDNPIKLVNRSIVAFRRQRAQTISARRRA